MTKEEIIAYVYLIMGISEEEIPLIIIETLYDIRKAAQPDLDDCLLTYYLVLDCYTWLIRNSISKGGIAGARIREREGGLEFEEQQGQGKSYADYWQTERDKFEASPNLPCLVGNSDSRGKVIIGRVRLDEHTRVTTNSNSMGNGYQIGCISSTRSSSLSNPFRLT